MKVFISRKIIDAGLNLLESNGFELDIWDSKEPISREELIKRSSQSDAIISMLSDKIDKDFIDKCPNLKVITNYAVGFNNIDIEYATKKGIAVGNTPNVLTDATADTAFALLITAARRIVESYESIAQKEWITWEPMGFLGTALKGKTLGIVGMGRIGQAMAKRCFGGFDMDVLYYSRTSKPEADKLYNAKQVDMDTLLKESDFISVHTDLNPDTLHMFDKEAFKKMKKSSIFVNTARGPIHKEDDLINALKTGEIKAAGLDVTDPEPTAYNSDLIKLKNVVVTPHIGSGDTESRAAMSMICANNIIKGLEKEKLPGFVNPELFE